MPEATSSSSVKPEPPTHDDNVARLLAKIEALELENKRQIRPIIADIEKYDGKSSFQFKIFLTDIKEKQMHDCKAHGGERGFMNYTYSRLTGKARAKVAPHMETYYSMKDGKKALKAFYTFLEETFSDPSAQQLALDRASSMKMGRRSMADYISEAEQTFLEADGDEWPESIKISFLRNGLSAEMADKMVSAKSYTTFKDYKKDLLVVAANVGASKGIECFKKWLKIQNKFGEIPNFEHLLDRTTTGCMTTRLIVHLWANRLPRNIATILERHLKHSQRKWTDIMYKIDDEVDSLPKNFQKTSSSSTWNQTRPDQIQQQSKTKCFFCTKLGHRESECRTKKTWERRNITANMSLMDENPSIAV
ncbi:hypothetical protein HOO65_021182 [Ceratocystis lukuohia]|uniref:CCHC-type domain-containing protein n=1 Tax=Ceratocystis lukuohia TaxID=2019550 RepID=A0ABR4MQV9_9PEZI